MENMKKALSVINILLATVGLVLGLVWGVISITSKDTDAKTAIVGEKVQEKLYWINENLIDIKHEIGDVKKEVKELSLKQVAIKTRLDTLTPAP